MTAVILFIESFPKPKLNALLVILTDRLRERKNDATFEANEDVRLDPDSIAKVSFDKYSIICRFYESTLLIHFAS